MPDLDDDPFGFKEHDKSFAAGMAGLLLVIVLVESACLLAIIESYNSLRAKVPALQTRIENIESECKNESHR